MVVTKKGDAAAALILIAGMGVVYANSLHIQDDLNYALGALFFPYVMIGTITVFALMLLFQSVEFSASPAKSKTGSEPQKNAGVFLIQAGLVAMLAFYIFILPYAGYVPTTVVFLFMCMIFLGERAPRNMVIYGVCSAATTGLLYIIFGKILLIFLP